MNRELSPNVQKPIDSFLSHFSKTRSYARGYVAHCPAHNDGNSSLMIWEDETDGHVGVKCHAGCSRKAICYALGIEETELYVRDKKYKPRSARHSMDIMEIARAKGILPQILTNCGVLECHTWITPRGRSWRNVLRIIYHNADGSEYSRARIRTGLKGDVFFWDGPENDPLIPYGLNRLQNASNELIIVEGESDCWTLWQYGVAAIGIPGAGNTSVLQEEHIKLFPQSIFIIKEPPSAPGKPDTGQKFVEGVTGRLLGLGYSGSISVIDLKKTHGVKDPNELNLKLIKEGRVRDFKTEFQRAQRAMNGENAQENQEKETAEAGSDYEIISNKMFLNSKKDGPIQISNFRAEIVADVITDDGAEQVRSYDIQAVVAGRRAIAFSIPAKDFPKCDWVDEHLGARAMITTGQSMKSHLVNAIKTCSDPAECSNFAHTGWREIDGEMVYLHAGGGISQSSQVSMTRKEDLTKFSFLDKSAPEASLESIRKSNSQVSQNSQLNNLGNVKLVGSLSNYILPDPGPSFKQDIRASLAYVDLASDRITMPIYAAIWRSVLGQINFSLHVAGASGLGKSAIVALAQQHFGASMIAENLPGSWGSTDNSLEMLLFQAKDTVVVVDDFKPVGSKNDQDRLHAKADRIFRQIGNGSTRGRLDSNLQQRTERRSRCLLISTGEDVPRGQSLKSRGVLVTMDERITAGAAKKALSLAQQDASAGLYTQAMSGYIQWLAPRIEEIQKQLTTLVAIERDQLATSGHSRTTTNSANLIVGIKFFLQYAYESGAIAKSEALYYLDRIKDALASTAEEADQENKQEKPSEQWRRLIVAALTSKKAYLDNSDGDFQAPSGSERIGWIEGDDIFLFPVVAYKVAKAMGSATGDEVTTLEPTLRKFLNTDGFLATTDLGTKRKTITVRKSFEKIQQSILHIKASTLYDAPYPVGVDLPDLVDYSESETAPEAAREPSQRVDYSQEKLTNLVDYDLTKSKSNGHKHLATGDEDVMDEYII